jgi:hypothetical protein
MPGVPHNVCKLDARLYDDDKFLVKSTLMVHMCVVVPS